MRYGVVSAARSSGYYISDVPFHTDTRIYDGTPSLHSQMNVIMYFLILTLNYFTDDASLRPTLISQKHNTVFLKILFISTIFGGE